MTAFIQNFQNTQIPGDKKQVSGYERMGEGSGE